ncbi:hypothetical protein ACHAXT_013194, partial [Thalassiosira profunda]
HTPDTRYCRPHQTTSRDLPPPRRLPPTIPLSYPRLPHTGSSLGGPRRMAAENIYSSDAAMTAGGASNIDAPSRLAQEASAAAEKGDTAALHSLLNIATAGEGIANRSAGDSCMNNGSAATSNERCRELLSAFLSLVGRRDDEWDAPPDVKAHLLLRALLLIPHGYSTPWEAAIAAVQSLQYQESTGGSHLSHGEELAMMSEIRSFVTSLRTEGKGSTNPTQIHERLLELGNVIVAPLLMIGGGNASQNGDKKSNRARRQNQNLMPLQLIPAILAAMDAVDDTQENLPVKNDSGINVEDGDAMLAESGDAMGAMPSRASDRLLSSIDYGDGKKLRRAMRADASLPLLSLALDDIGVQRMSASLPVDDGVTYWDCLDSALNDALSANLLCHSEAEVEEESKRQVIEAASEDEGVHIVPLSDYPALMRCVFRMVAGSFASNKQWEHLLLRLYHSCAVATSTAPFPALKRPKSSREMDRLATLSTVESHVLLPSCTGASVSTTKAILEACIIRASCPSCMHDTRRSEGLDGDDVVPTWAIAGLALLIMRARASDLSRSAMSTSFGPRSVFRIASDVLRKRKADGPNASSGRTDEVGCALSVLLHLSGFKNGTCHSCRDGSFHEDTEGAARDILPHSFYANGQFCHRYMGPQEYSYLHHLGFHTLSSYSQLVCASLHHGALHDAGKVQTADSFVADTARSWIDAANMLLDDSDRYRSSSRTLDGTAMAIVIITVVFFEVPSSQDRIVRSIYDRVANMASHNLHSQGGQCEKSWLSLTSVLAWSLVEMDRTGASADVVRRKGGSRDHVASVLGPLCSLLSKSAQGQLNGLSSSSDGLPFWAIRQLAHALSPTPSGRNAILAMAQKHLSVLSSSAPYSHPASKTAIFFESLPSTPSAANDAIYLALDSLRLLVETVPTSKNSAEDDDCCREALRVLTDIIILLRPTASSHLFSATPCISSELTSWILDELNKSARLGKLSQWTSQRLLRACYFAMLQCTSFEETEKDDLSPLFAKHARSDVPALLRLALSLYDQRAKANETMLASHSFLRPYLQRALNNQFDETIDDSIKQSLHAGYDTLQGEFDPLDTSADSAVDSVFLLMFAESAAKMIQKKLRPERVDSVEWKKLVEYIRQAERHHYPGAENRDTTQTHRSTSLPSWIEVQYFQDPSVRPEFLLSTVSNLLQQSLCDVLSDSMLKMWAHQTTNEDDAGDSSALLSVHSALGCKRAEHKLAGTSPEKLVLGAMPDDSICSLLELSSQHFRLLLGNSDDKKDALEKVDLVVENLIDACRAIQSKEGRSSQSRLLTSFWAVYCSLADDESSQIFCSFVKECYIDIGKFATEEDAANYDIGESSYSLLMITSPADLDFHVRHLREAFLLTLSTVIASIPASKNELSPDERKASLEILLLILPQICQDLDAGFHGYSGGLTKKLMLLFLDVMEKCIDAMAALFGCLPAGDQCQFQSSFISVQQSATILWLIFREDSLRQASVVKGALRLCIDKMPSLMRRVERIVEERIVDTSLCEQLCTALDECTASSSSALEQKQNDTNKSSDAGAVSTSVGSDAAPNPVSEDNGGEELILAPKQSTEDGAVEGRDNLPAESGGGKAQTPKFPANTLAWAYSCAFAAVANIFGDSHRIITGRSPAVGHRSTHSRETQPALALRRFDDFSRVHASLCHLFGGKVRREGTADDAKVDPDEAPMILAETLSHHGKSNLCSCVEKMANALSLSVKCIVKYCEDPTPLGRTQNSRADTKLNESLVCLLGWMHSFKRNETKHDLITGTLQWYINEKRHFDLSMFGKDGSYPILGRLPKVIFRLEGLEAEVRKLNVLVADLSRSDDGQSKAKISVLNELISQPTGNGAEGFADLLQECVATLDARKNALKLSELEGDLASEEDESDADIEGEDFAWPGKRRRHRYAPVRKSRRMALRSRNDTIDDWLAMDDDEFGAAPGEKYNADDAFVDLEDFLVEG